MLTRKFPREPARLAILRRMTGGDPEASAPLTRQALAQLVAGAGGSEAFVPDVVNAWQRAGWVAGVVDRLSSMTVMGDRLDARGRRVGPQEETRDQRLHVIANMFGSSAVGEEPEDISPLLDFEALYDRKGKVRHDERGHYVPTPSIPQEEDRWRSVLETMADMTNDLMVVLAKTPLVDLAEAAAASRSTARTWRMLGGQSDDPEAVDDDAAMLAPIALLIGPENWPKDESRFDSAVPPSAGRTRER
jgi:hypothetical protein